jgi:cytoskeleton protein RodZ
MVKPASKQRVKVQEHGDNTTSVHDPSVADKRGGATGRMVIDTRIGPWLQTQRVALGFAIPDLSRQLKLQSRYIQALENDDFASLPGQPYLGGYVRSLAKALDLDPQEAMQRLRAASSQPDAAEPPKQLNFLRPSIERRLPVSAIISVSLAVSIAAYAYWYVTKSADMGRPLLSPVADLEATTEPQAEYARITPAPGPLQPLGVPALADSVDAANALGTDAKSTARQPLPIGAVPRPRPGTEAAVVWTAQVEWPLADSDLAQSPMVASKSPSRVQADMEGLPASASLAAYLPAVRLRSDLGPLRGTAGLPPVVQVARHVAVDNGVTEPRPVARTQAFAAVPSSASLMLPLGRDGNAGGTHRASVRTHQPYDPLATLPPVTPDADAPTETIQIIADEPCWIEIRTATGRAIAQRLLQVGEQFNIPRRAGLNLTAGNAGGIRVLVDGVTVASLGSVGQVVRGVSLNPYHLRAQR